jgi:Tol biopolymer transport system component
MSEFPVGSMAQVVADERLVVRSAPGTGDDSEVLEPRLYQAMRVRVLEGPVAASGYDWLRVRVGRIEGWVGVAGRDRVPWLRPLGNGRIAFVRDYGPDSRIMLIDSDGGHEEVLVADPVAEETSRRDHPAVTLALSCGAGVYEPRWSPTGDSLVFASGTCGDDDIYRVHLQSRQSAWLAAGGEPAWTPDAHQVNFAENAPIQGCGEPDRAELARIDASGGKPIRITQSAACFFAWGPHLSPDATTIAFTGTVRERSGGSQGVYLVDADGTTPRVIATGWDPRWAPDGMSLLYQVPRSSTGGTRIGLMDPAIGETMILTTGYDAEWSPDGAAIAYVDQSGSTADDGPEYSVYLMAPDGSGRRVLSSGAQGFAWAPDGSALVVVMDRTSTQRGDIAVVPIDGSDSRILGVGYYPAWQPRLVP